MALKQQMGLGGLSARTGHVQVRVVILDVHGDALFDSRYMPGAHFKALAHARYWLKRGGVIVQLSDAAGKRRRVFRTTGWRFS